MRKQVILTLSSFAVFLVGVYLAYGFAAVLFVGGAAGFITGLLWDSE